MGEEAPGSSRGFVLQHQRNVLEIDFAGVLTASAFLTIQPTVASLRTIYLHASPLLQINNVTLSSPTASEPLLSTPASFTLSNPFQPLPTREPAIDIRSHPEIKRKTWAAMGERDEGELAISVSGGWVRLVESLVPDGPKFIAPIHVQIDYQLVLGGNVVEGIVFRRPGDGGDEYQIPHMFLSPTTYEAARIWTPCVDSLWERCTWELEFIVPRYLHGGESGSGDESAPVTVISSGELMEQVTHPHDPHKVIFYYLQTNPTSVQHISFAAGPFEMHCISAEGASKTLLGFCLPGDIDMLKPSTSFLPRAMAFYTEMGSYPFTDFKMVFVSGPRVEASTSATLAILSSDLLHPPNVIEQAMEIRQVLSLSLIQQWMGINIIQRSLSDTWLVNGLALYIQNLFLRHLLGNNEYRFRLKKDMDRCVRQDQGSQWPLCVPGQVDPPDAATTAFINLKAPLVLHILDRHLAKAGTSLGLSAVIPGIFVASLTDEIKGSALSTQWFFKRTRKTTGIDLQTFFNQWVYGSGCPRLIIRTLFIKKKLVVEFTVNQEVPAKDALNQMSEKQKKFAIWKRPTQLFEGSLTVRIHEADGAPFEHLVDIKTASKTFPLPFNTKYKRTRRSGRIAARFSNMQDALAAVDENDEDEARLQAADRAGVFAYPPWEDDDERRRWKVSEWGEEQANQMMGEGAGYEWIRVDPECEWLASIEFQEKPWYWISQLQGDRDVIAQLEAVQNMRLHPSPVIASELARTVLVKNYYYRVRMEAARALVVYNNSECDYVGYFLVLKLFQKLYCHPPINPEAEAQEIECHILPNDFSNFADYFVKKSLLASMAELRDPATRTVWRNVRKTLLEVVTLNDNSKNDWSDSYYLAAAITALGNAFTAGSVNQASFNEAERDAEQSLLKEATDALDRAMTVDRLVPSYHNLVTKAGLQSYIKSIYAGQRTNDARLLLSYTREGNFEPIRMVAFDGLFLCKPPGRSLAIDRYLLDVIRSDHSLTIRRHVARGLSESIVMTLVVGEVAGAAAPPGVVDVTNDTEQAREQRSEATNMAIVKALRKDYSKKLDIKQLVQDALVEGFTSPDDEIRLALLKVAEAIASSTAEPLPGNIITLQGMTPTLETPALATPKIRLSMGSADIRPDSQGYGFPVVEEKSITVTPLRISLSSNPNAITPPVSKKKEKVHKSQKRGLPDMDRKAIEIALQKLLPHKTSFFFRQPVDPVRDGAPDYTAIITKPMDLSTIRAKFDNGMYASRLEFVQDIRLMISNCYTYNIDPRSPVRLAGEAFESMFNGLWIKTENTLSSSAAKAQRQQIAAQMPAPPVPIATPAEIPAPVSKLKVKTPKTVTIDTSAERVPPMAPPPLPTVRKISLTPGSARSSPEKPPPPKFSAVTTSTDKPKKRKERSKNELDDLLGAEIDAMENGHGHSQNNHARAFEDLLEPQKPPAKKIKLPPAISRKSPEKEKVMEPKLSLKGKSIITPSPAASAPAKRKSPEKTPAPKSKTTPVPASAASPVEVKPSIKKVKNTAPREERSSASPIIPAPVKFKKPTPTPTPPPPISRPNKPSPAPALPPSIPTPPSSTIVYSARSQPPDLPPTTQNTTSMKTKRAKNLLNILMKEPAAFLYLQPVDPIRDGCPTYLDEIKHPMDFGTMQKKLDGKKYRTLGQFARDVELVFANCRQFNPPGEITALADAVEAVYWREWPKVASSRMTPDERKAMVALVNQAIKSPLSEWFRTAVDPVLLQIPQYFDIIPQEDARDLSLIKNKLDKGQYSSSKQIDDDVELMLENARVFNGEGIISDAANAFGRWWASQRARIE